MRNRTKTRRLAMAVIALVLMVAVSGIALARGSRQAPRTQRYGPGSGPGSGMMGPTGGYRGHHGGMMHGYRDGYPQGYGRGVGGERISDEHVQAVLDESLSYWGNGNLEVAEIMEFEYNYYAQVKERGSEVNAFELLVDPYSGSVYPEPGPNMMWNTEYGHMGRRWFGGIGGNRVDEAEAERIASEWIARYSTSATVGDVAPFPGYYTLHVFDGGDISGMLSVHARSGEVWYHDWHGDYLGMVVGHR